MSCTNTSYGTLLCRNSVVALDLPGHLFLFAFFVKNSYSLEYHFDLSCRPRKPSYRGCYVSMWSVSGWQTIIYSIIWPFFFSCLFWLCSRLLSIICLTIEVSTVYIDKRDVSNKQNHILNGIDFDLIPLIETRMLCILPEPLRTNVLNFIPLNLAIFTTES